ncbi:hypothetical protein [Vulcanisaeta distributa]|uniref:hypothetical protein n=1 Tax=Vulcanisaeta distributa TaxID=164451 RepID=UPI0006CF7384|nr:hypothetical protein [Vulcanisaeta distributa]
MVTMSVVIAPGPYGDGKSGALIRLSLALILIGLVVVIFSILAHSWTYFNYALSIIIPGVGFLIYAYTGHKGTKRRREYVESHNAIWGFNNALVTPSKGFKSGEVIYTIFMAIITFVIVGGRLLLTSCMVGSCLAIPLSS